MDEDLPYAGDVSYEEQLPESLEDAGPAGLKERIGNRVYLLEDSLSRKRKLQLEDVEEDEQADDVHDEGDASHRPNAILINGPPIAHLPTARVFAYATHFDAHPIGLEWVDDQTCVLVFASRKSALQAWGALRKVSQSASSDADGAIQVEDTNANDVFHPALPLPLALYPIEERINSVLGNNKTATLKEPMQLRWAHSSDVKKPGARVESEFYKKHGETAGKEGFPGFSTSRGNKRRRRNEDDLEMRNQLDDELDTFLEGGDQVSSNTLTRRVGVRQTNRTQDDEERRRLLDDELDSFLANGEDAEQSIESTDTVRLPSLLDRTAQSQSKVGSSRQTKSLPRRSLRGRWLHNAEIGSGLRAWATERPGPQDLE